MGDVEIFEQDLMRDGRKVGKVAILRGGLDTANPTAIMNTAVLKYVKSTGHNQFVEIHLDNPWVRVVIDGINELEYKPFDKQEL